MKIYPYILVFLLSGCSSAYIPSPKNIPLFEEKGEYQIEAGASTNSVFAAGSYAFSEKFSLIANGSMSYCYILGKPFGWSSGEPLSISFSGDVPHRSIEAGIGRYNLLPSSQRRLEVFAGVGYGAAHSFNSEYKQNYLLGFVQANTGKKYRHTEMGWSLRAAFSGFHESYGSTYPEYYYIENGKYQAFHLEPLFVIRTGGQRLKVSFRTGINLAFPLSFPSKIVTLRGKEGYPVFHLSCGLSYQRFREKKMNKNTGF